MRLLISGGHITPALALIDYIQNNSSETEIIFAGRIYNRQGDLQPSPEKYEIDKRGVRFITFDSGKLGEGNLISKIIQVFKTIKSTLSAIVIVARVQPSMFVSFGGYLAVPIAIASWFWRVPIITHEQTRTIGVANKLILPLVRRIGLSFEETATGLPASKVVLTGNPVRQTLFEESEKPTWLKGKISKPILYITGGSQGSEVINSTIARMSDTLLKDWLIIHQCGSASKDRNYEAELNHVRARVSKVKQERYFIRPWIDEKDLAWIYNHAEAIITRAGANTLMEITLKAVPSIIIPLPFSNNDEQLLNAKSLSDNKAAILLLQKDLNPETLASALEEINFKHASLKKQLQKIASKHRHATQNLFAEIQKIHHK